MYLCIFLISKEMNSITKLCAHKNINKYYAMEIYKKVELMKTK